jgi:hypothetical protein
VAEANESLAKANEKTAKDREAETRAVLSFVENKVFAAARPDGYPGGPGAGVTLRRAVEAALPFVDEGFREQPLIEARLRKTMGQSFEYLGDSRTAAAQFEKSRAIYVKHLGTEHPDTVTSMSSLATSYSRLGRHAEASSSARRPWRCERPSSGPNTPTQWGVCTTSRASTLC